MPSHPSDTPLTLMSSLVVRKALDGGVLSAYEQASGSSLRTEYVPTTILLERLDAGAEPDVLIGTREALLRLEGSAVVVGSGLPLVRSAIGLGVASGAPRPAITTESDLIDALLGARSVAFSRAGQSGIFFQELLGRLGIADQVLSRATALDTGFTGVAVTDGRADLALQQVSELMFVDGVDVVGPLPHEFQHYSVFAVAVGSGAANRHAAEGLVRHLTGPAAREAYAATGLQNLHPGAQGEMPQQ
ncbi:molybdate transport system substrate-binding protein [Arthrobacter sp. CAN_A6]|uniref:substrate-binding domain-containing protein n=1 Tax=Arthrobacter sp. CAN_A6 TaxID=2787721 RepID=UPI0018CAD1EA